MSDVVRREARLIILRFLAEQDNRSLSSTALTIQANEIFLLGQERPWIEQEMRYLAKMGAIKVTPAGSILIGTLLPHGAKHLAWMLTIPDVMRPSDPIDLPEASY